MELQASAEKLPIPRLCPSSQKTFKQFKTASAKLEAKRLRERCRINIGDSFDKWRSLRKLKRHKSDEELAEFLLSSYEKLTELSSAKKPEPVTFGPQQNHERSSLTAPCPPSKPVLDTCPSCGFALLQWCLQNGNPPNKEHQFESIEVTLELEQKDDPVSGAEEADGESDVSEEDEESEGSGVDGENGKGKNSDKDWTPGWHCIQTLKATNTNPTETPAVEEESAHKQGKKQLCTECGVFYQSKVHECEHKTKPFVCNICGRRCVSETALKIHNRIHSESYEHACKYCHANFKSRVDKLAHELIHQAQQDPYKCPDCTMTFETFTGRAEHMKEHGNDFKCALCGIVFNRKSQFLRHLVVHTGERPYSCGHCGKSFNHNISLENHVQRCHPTEEEDISRETQERSEENKGAAATPKNKWLPTRRPKERPKRNAADKRKYSNTTDHSDAESD